MVHGSRSWVVDGSGSRGRMIDGCRGWMDSGFVLGVLGHSLVFHISHVATIASLENNILHYSISILKRGVVALKV